MKQCFVIGPIGKIGSETRTRSDNVLKHIIEPALAQCGYRALRADQISQTGSITTQIIERLVLDELVIADLSELNPNVFYELAVRHAARKPVIQVIESAFDVPFDIAPYRTIVFDSSDLGSAAHCIDELVAFVRSLDSQSAPPDSPLQIALDYVKLTARNTLAVGIDVHYEEATRLVKRATRSIVLCQRTSTFLTGPERGRQREIEFRQALLSALERGVTVHHLIHEESCMSDIWEMPGKFDLTMAEVPNSERLFIGRYLGTKPFPRLLIIDEAILGCVFDIDQVQFYSVVEVPEVQQVAQYAIRYVTDRGQIGFHPQYFLERLRTALHCSELVHSHLDSDQGDIFAQYLQIWLTSLHRDAGQRDYFLSTDSGSVSIPLAWPNKMCAVFLDTAGAEDQLREREQMWEAMNSASEAGWRTLFFSRSHLLLRLDDVKARILKLSQS